MEHCGGSSGGREPASKLALTDVLPRLILNPLCGRASICLRPSGCPRFTVAEQFSETVAGLLALRRFLIFHIFRIPSSQLLAFRNSNLTMQLRVIFNDARVA